VVLSGHEHSYERLEVDGIPYIVNGSGGAALRGFGRPLPESRARDAAHHGAQRIELSDDGARIEFWGVDGHKIDDIALPRAEPLPCGVPRGAR